jgi:exopolyphosphatase/guanosine-5'-triphosphate,3'-diphosphate pyrophosphatase
MNEVQKRSRAVISLGTNTVRVLVVEDVASGRLVQIEHRALGTRLGEGLEERGVLREAAMLRTLEAVRSFMDVVRRYDASLVCIATSAMRRAENAAAFEVRMREETGVPLRVIDGEAEATASFRGATHMCDDTEAPVCDGKGARKIAVLDIGGGSTECALGTLRMLERSVSLEIGTVRLTERFPGLDASMPGERAREAARQARAAVAGIMRPLEAFAPVDELRAVAGTSATIAAIVTAGDVEHVRGVSLEQEAVASVLQRLLDASLEERRAIPGMLAQRADVLAAGAIILDTAMEALRCERALVETNDLLLGYLLGR